MKATTMVAAVLGLAVAAEGWAAPGRIGAEYFLPGTKSFSLEGRVGIGLDLVSTKDTATGTASTSSSTTGFGIKDLTGGAFMLRYYFD